MQDTQIVPIVPDRSGETGNTKQISPAKRWCFTLNKYTEGDIKDIIDTISSNSSNKYVFQEETGECGTKHLQGTVVFSKKIRPIGMFNNKTIHWEKMKGSVKQSVAYCQKEDTRTGKVYIKGFKEIKPIKVISVLRPWQQEIVDIVNKEPDDRSIYWYWETKGNVGKSALVKYLCVKYDALICAGKGADMKYACAKYIEKHETGPDIVIFDIPRSVIDYVSWSGIEEIKNGCFMSNKYESQTVVMNSPHILCFANSEPDTELLSKDRWKIKEIR